MKRVLVTIVCGFVAAGCGSRATSRIGEPSVSPPDTSNAADFGRTVGVLHDGAQLFEKETFGGNGRTCSTCHKQEDGFSTTPGSARKRFNADPADSLFRPTDSDDGAGDRYTRLLAHATIRVEIPLRCQNIWLEDDPDATSVVVNRGIPELLNTPALDPILMSDGRVPNLEQQAIAAVRDHVAPAVQPEVSDLQRIAQYELGNEFFSSDVLRDFARGGPAPQLPPGTTEEEIHGRLHYLPNGLCGRCHSGPMLNTTTEASVVGPGQRFNNTLTGELVPDQRTNPFRNWRVVNYDGTLRTFSLPDPGRMLITCNRGDLTKFKIRSLWNVKNTAPYFHDHSAKTLEDVIEHYRLLFIRRKITVSDLDLGDMLAYLRLL